VAAWLALIAPLAVTAQAAAVIAAPSHAAGTTDWPGTLTVAVDATDLDHHLQRVTETLPVAGPGPLTLLFPRWLPGHHGPNGDVSQLAGLMVHAGSQRLAWRRDPLDPFAFQVDVPAGVRELTLQFEHMAPLNWEQGRPTMTRSILGVQWNQVLLYPAGTAADHIRVLPRVKLPAGWQQASALRDAKGQIPQPGRDGWLEAAPMLLETLVDSPVFASAHLRRIELDPPGTPQPVALNLVADEASQLEASPEQIEAHRRLVQQADKLYGARHWRQYDFLLALSERFGGIGLEHHESSENGVNTKYFKDWDKAINARELLPHEFTHSWNGKYRRPADLDTPHFNTPMQNSLLWVYEGMTQFWGHVLTARSGLSTPEQARDQLARTAAWLDATPGRTWRNLQDTTNGATINAQHDGAWRDWQRGFDYYDEATLIWLDADSLIREKSGGTKSMDDFAKAFFGIATRHHADGAIQPATYTFDEVVRTLNSVQPHDWAAFLRERVETNRPGAPLDGLARSGWKLAWSDKESEFSKSGEGRGGKPTPADFVYSLGLRVADDGKLVNVAWNSPAFQAGLAPDQTLVAVNLQAYKADKLAEAITANKDGKAPLQLLVRENDQYRIVTLDWRGGLRYPKLERIEGTPDRLTPLYTTR
jgi:predicted metalloprotease with PDZ domain